MTGDDHTPDPFTNLYEGQAKMVQAFFAPWQNIGGQTGGSMPGATAAIPADMQQWAEVATKLQGLWFQLMAEQAGKPQTAMTYLDPTRWMAMAQGWYKQVPLADPAKQKELWEDGLALCKGLSATSDWPSPSRPGCPRQTSARRRTLARETACARSTTHLFLAQRANGWSTRHEGLHKTRREKLRFAIRHNRGGETANIPF